MHRIARYAGLALAALLASACGHMAADGSGGAGHTTWRPVTVSGPARVSIRGGSARQRALLGQIVYRMRPVALGSLTIAPVTDRGSKPRPGDVELTATPRKGFGTRDSRPGWEAWMIGGAFRDRSATAGLPRLLWLSEPDGGERIQPANARGTRPFTGSLAGLKAAVHRAAARVGRVVSVRVGDPLGGTADVTLQTGRPIWFLRHGVNELESALRGWHLDGALIDAYEGNGKHLGSWGYSNRLSSGLAGVWDSTLRTCADFWIGGPFEGVAPQLPCPSSKRPSPDQPERPLRIHGYESAERHGTAGLGFALQNWNGHTATVTSISVSPEPAAAGYIGALVRRPANRADVQDGRLVPPYGPQPPLRPFDIAPGDWAFVQLDFAAPPCTASTKGEQLHVRVPFAVTYRLDGSAHTVREDSTSVDLRVPGTC